MILAQEILQSQAGSTESIGDVAHSGHIRWSHLCFHILMVSIEIQVLGKWFPTEVPVLSIEGPDRAVLG